MKLSCFCCLAVWRDDFLLVLVYRCECLFLEGLQKVVGKLNIYMLP